MNGDFGMITELGYPVPSTCSLEFCWVVVSFLNTPQPGKHMETLHHPTSRHMSLPLADSIISALFITSLFWATGCICWHYLFVGWNIFFPHIFGLIIQIDYYFSEGLEPPTGTRYEWLYPPSASSSSHLQQAPPERCRCRFEKRVGRIIDPETMQTSIKCRQSPWILTNFNYTRYINMYQPFIMNIYIYIYT